jgi:MFS family permease
MRPADPARATGITQTGVFAGATLGPPAFGALVEATSYRVGWIATAVAAALAGGLVLAMDRRIGPKSALHRGAVG